MSVPEAPPVASAQGGEVRELRLAVVLYGGASLAIYMHGTTKELQRLVKASALADRGGDGDDRERAGVRRAARGARPARPRTASARASSSTSSPGRRPAGSTASTSRRRSRTTGRRTRCATSGSTAATSRCCCAGPSWLPALLKVPLLLAGAVKKPVLKGDAIAQWMYARAPRHGRGRVAAGRARDADAAVARARAVRHGDRLPRLPPRRRDRRPEADRRAGAPARALVPPRRRRRPVRRGPQRRARLLGAHDDELPRRVPAGQPGVVPGGGGEGGRRRLAGAAGALPDLRARARGPGRDVLHRRRRARQQALRPRDRRDQAAGRRVRGRAAAALPRAGPRRRRRRRAGRRLAEPDRDRARVDLGPAASGAGARRHPRGQPATTSASCGSSEIVETSFDPIRRRIEEIVGTELDRLTREQSPAERRAVAHPDQRGREGGRRLRLRDLPPQQGERRRRQLRADDLPPLRLPGRLQPGGVRARRRPLLGRHAPADATRPAGRLRPTTWSRSCARSTSPTARAGCAS